MAAVSAGRSDDLHHPGRGNRSAVVPRTSQAIVDRRSIYYPPSLMASTATYLAPNTDAVEP